MIEAGSSLHEEARLLNKEQEAKLERAELITKRATKAFTSLDTGSEHYGRNYGNVVRDLACAYRLAYEAANTKSPSQSQSARRTRAVLHEIGMFCQMNRFVISEKKLSLPGLETVDVTINTENANK